MIPVRKPGVLPNLISASVVAYLNNSDQSSIAQLYLLGGIDYAEIIVIGLRVKKIELFCE